MSKLGFRTMNEMIGRTDRLSVDPAKLNAKSATLDLSPILMAAQVSRSARARARDAGLLRPAVACAARGAWPSPSAPDAASYTPARPWRRAARPQALNPESPMVKTMQQDHGIPDRLDFKLLPRVKAAIDSGSSVVVEHEIVNIDRSFGAIISNYLSKRSVAPTSAGRRRRCHASGASQPSSAAPALTRLSSRLPRLPVPSRPPAAHQVRRGRHGAWLHPVQAQGARRPVARLRARARH